MIPEIAFWMESPAWPSAYNSYKDTFESEHWTADTFASGNWRGAFTVTPTPVADVYFPKSVSPSDTFIQSVAETDSYIQSIAETDTLLQAVTQTDTYIQSVAETDSYLAQPPAERKVPQELI